MLADTVLLAFRRNIQDSDIPLFGLPLCNGVIPASHGREEGVRRPHEFEGRPRTNPNFDGKMAVLVINDRRRLAERNAVKQPFAHNPPLHLPNTTEQLESEPANLNAGNIAATGLPTDMVNFRQSAFLFRPTVEQFRVTTGVITCSFRNVVLPTPANDDEPDWREAA